MKVRSLSPADFLARAGSWLEEREAENQLFFRMTGALQARMQVEESAKFFATVEEGHEIFAVAGMTPPYHLVVSRAPAAAIPALIDYLNSTGIVPTGVNGLKETSVAFAAAWAAGHDVTPRVRMELGVYEATSVTAPAGVGGRLRTAVESDVPLLARWCQAFSREALGAAEHETDEQALVRARRWLTAGGVAIWQDGEPRAMTNATGKSPHGICLNGVYTPPEFRRRGYASACVAALTDRLLGEGRRFVCLFTDLSNPTSNSIYQKVGYRWVCEFADYDFVPSA